MIVKQTEKYKCIQATPWCSLGQIFDEDTIIDCEKFPKLFAQIYEFETGEQIIQGDNIWRIVIQGNGVQVVKCVQFQSNNHLTLDIFPSYEAANAELEKINANLGLLHKDKNILTILSQVKLFSNTNNLDELTFKELTRRITNINDLVKDV